MATPSVSIYRRLAPPQHRELDLERILEETIEEVCDPSECNVCKDILNNGSPVVAHVRLKPKEDGSEDLVIDEKAPHLHPVHLHCIQRLFMTNIHKNITNLPDYSWDNKETLCPSCREIIINIDGFSVSEVNQSVDFAKYAIFSQEKYIESQREAIKNAQEKYIESQREAIKNAQEKYIESQREAIKNANRVIWVARFFTLSLGLATAYSYLKSRQPAAGK